MFTYISNTGIYSITPKESDTGVFKPQDTATNAKTTAYTFDLPKTVISEMHTTSVDITPEEEKNIYKKVLKPKKLSR